MRIWISLFLLSAAFCAGCAPIGTVRLRAVDAISGKPLANARIERQVPMYQPCTFLGYPVACYLPNPRCETEAVNLDGQADFPRALTDQRFMVRAPGYEPVLVNRVFPWTSAWNWNTSDSVATQRHGGVITVSLSRATEPEEIKPPLRYVQRTDMKPTEFPDLPGQRDDWVPCKPLDLPDP